MTTQEALTPLDDVDENMLCELAELFKIFGDSVLRELARKRPMCPADAAGIKGIGPQKMYSVLRYFLNEIQNWCNGQ